MKTVSVTKADFRFLLFLAAGMIALAARADVATLREKGPKSGTAFSNPGLTEMSADVKVVLRDAEVKILLKKGAGHTLLAECEADFVLENIAPADTGPQDFLVAFPVTGLRSKAVTIDRFAVSVDGKTPPTVLRQAITISKRESTLKDKVISGQLDARFAPAKSAMQWGISLTDQTVYPNAYVWAQHTTPNTKTRVKVTYLVTLLPQPVQHSKSYQSSSDDSEVIPFANIRVDAAKGNYYFFDYVLLSGATWEKAIDHETITLKVSPELQLHAQTVTLVERNPVGYRPEAAQTSVSMEIEEGFTDDSIIVELKNKKPTSDLLFAIPESAIGWEPTQ